MNDLRYALRTLARSPGFALAAVVTLAVGIGANAAVFSVVEKVLLRPLPFEGANRLFVIRETSARQDRMGVSGPDFDDFYAQARSFDAFAATVPHFTLTWTGDGEARTVNCAGVTKDIFPALGLRPLMGRVYTPEEYHVDGVQVVISRRFWKTQLGGDPNVLGRVLHLDGTAQTVIGVMPDVPDLFPDVDVWGKIVPELEFMHWRQNHFLTVIGRLKATASPAQAAQELTAILHRAGPESRELTATVAPLKAELVGDVRTQLMIVMGAVVLVLITGSMNVTCLLLARMSARTSELAIRVTLGAGRARMLRQFVTENLLLLCLGSALGLILAGALVQLGARLDLGAVPRAHGGDSSHSQRRSRLGSYLYSRSPRSQFSAEERQDAGRTAAQLPRFGGLRSMLRGRPPRRSGLAGEKLLAGAACRARIPNRPSPDRVRAHQRLHGDGRVLQQSVGSGFRDTGRAGGCGLELRACGEVGYGDRDF